jgi:hypothetical protein
MDAMADFTKSESLTVCKEAYAKVEERHVSVHLPTSFFTTYKIIPFHRVTKWNSNWNWGPDKTVQRENEGSRHSEVFLYKPSEVEFFTDDIIVSSTERVKQSESRTRNGKTTEMVYLIKRKDREKISSKNERNTIACALSMPIDRLNLVSALDEPEKELKEEKTVRGGSVVEDEYEVWGSVRVLAEVHNGDYNQLGYGFFNPTEVIPTNTMYNRQRVPEEGGWYLRGSAFKIVDKSWHYPGEGALDMAQRVKSLLATHDVPWDWHNHQNGLVFFSKNFEMELDPSKWMPALPYILDKIISKAADYNPSAQRAEEMFRNGMGYMQEMLTDPDIKGIRLPPALRRLQRLAYLAIPGEYSDGTARACYEFLKLKNKEPISQEILTDRRDRMHTYIQDLKIEAPEIFEDRTQSNRAVLASNIAALEPESVLLARRIKP